MSAMGCMITPPSGDQNPPSNPSYGCEVVLPDSLEQAESIKINTFTPAEREESNLSLVEAVQKVKRSSVAVMTDAGSGSGTIIDIDDGVNEKNVFYILTCHHVLEEARTVKVYVPDLNYRYGEDQNYIFSGTIGGERTKNQAVSLVGGDRKSDVAVLRLYIANDEVASTIVEAKIMSEEYSCVEGETVFAIGNPTGLLPGSVTDGIISYVNRNTEMDDIGVMTLLQIGVIISPGSSGGGLYNLYGELVGITNGGNASKFTFYAIPHKITNDVQTDFGFVNIVKQLVATCSEDNYGYISGRKQTIGFTVMTLQASTSTTYVSITNVIENSQADKQGLEIGDVVTDVEINGVIHPVTSIAEFSPHIDALKPGQSFTLHLLRDSQVKKVTLTVYQEYFWDTGKYPEGTEGVSPEQTPTPQVA